MRALLDRVPRLSPQAYQRVCLVTLAALAFIVVTGAAVRLTGSGLGCSDWPTCEQDQLIAPIDNFHAMVEFLNRVITGFVSVAIMIAVLGSLIRRPVRRDLVWWSLGLVGGLVAEIVLGGIQVKMELPPPFVMAHFALAMVLVWNAVVLEHRAGQPDGPPEPVVAASVRRLGRLLCGLAAIALFTGTLVTGSGPHGGDQRARRLQFFIPDVARGHSVVVICFLAATLLTLWILKRDGVPRAVNRRGQVLVGAIVVQAAVGYTQYFTGVPPLLVLLHIVGAAIVWIAVLRFHLGLWARAVETDTSVVRAEPLATTAT